MNQMKGLYVSQLEVRLQSIIQEQLIDFLKNDLKLNKEDIKIELELAMNSRVSDLEDTINIRKVLSHL